VIEGDSLEFLEQTNGASMCFSNAEHYFLEAIDLDSLHTKSYFEYAKLNCADGDFEQADNAMSNILDEAKHNEEYLNLCGLSVIENADLLSWII